MTAIFIITSNNKTLQSLNWRHLVFPCTGVDTMVDSFQLTQGGSKVRGLVNKLSENYVILTGISEQPDFRDFKIGIKKKKHWVDFYHYRMDVYTHLQHIFMFKQLEKLILHPMTPLNVF